MTEVRHPARREARGMGQKSAMYSEESLGNNLVISILEKKPKKQHRPF